MELIKRNIHMDRVKRSTVIQFTMEEDLNLPEDKPDGYQYPESGKRRGCHRRDLSGYG